MRLRFFGITKDGERNTYRSDSYGDPAAYLATVMSGQSHAAPKVVIAYEIYGSGSLPPPKPRTNLEFYDRCIAAIDDGNFVGGIKQALEALSEWAEAVGVRKNVGATPTTVTPSPVKPGQTLIVQEWLLSQDAQALADRAWAATMALGKGA